MTADKMFTLFDDQKQAQAELYAAARQGYKRPLLVAPTGYGKGTVASDIIRKALQKNPAARIIFLVNRRALVKDMSKRLTKLGIFHGILMGAQSRGQHMPVLIASQQTLHNRLK
ncbi:MAG: DEAD/DEAH box helicase family protein, partial [Candidatus Saccharimonadales bacterium]